MRRRGVGGTVVRQGGGTLLGALALFVAFTSPAFATTVGDVIENSVDGGYSNVPILINYVAYIAGVALCVVGLLKVMRHFTRSDQPLGPGIWHLAAAGLLISLPSAWAKLVTTLGLETPSGSTQRAADLPAASGGGGTLTLDQMMIDFVSDIRQPMGYLIWSLAAMLGLFFLTSAFIRMARNSGQDGPRGSMGVGTVMRILIGSILLSYAATGDAFTTTLFGGGTMVVFQEMVIPGVDAATLERANDALSAVLVFIQIVGSIAFLRGFLMLRAFADGNTSVSTAAAFTHIIGGAIAFNISPALQVIQNTFCSGGGDCAVFTFM